MKRKRYIIGGLITCLALGYLVYVLMDSFITYYPTVSDLIESGESIYDESVRVKGEVEQDSIQSNNENPVLTFTITDGSESLEVAYEGAKGDIPSNFGDQAQVVLEGKLDSAEIFHAMSILTECPSKYESEE
jgi:cytochrome c-type biogenesis protein CcmE